MTNRRAFTLLELIVSMAVAGIIALLVYGSASAGFDTRDALSRHRAVVESELRARVLLADALRHASDEADAGLAAFELVDAMDSRGVPSDQLAFLTRGMLSPLGASDLWTVTLTPSPDGLVVRGAPARSATGSSLAARLDGVRGLDVQVMSLADGTWSPAWPSSRQLPAAVQVTFYDATGGQIGARIVVRVGLEGVR